MRQQNPTRKYTVFGTILSLISIALSAFCAFLFVYNDRAYIYSGLCVLLAIISVVSVSCLRRSTWSPGVLSAVKIVMLLHFMVSVGFLALFWVRNGAFNFTILLVLITGTLGNLMAVKNGNVILGQERQGLLPV